MTVFDFSEELISFLPKIIKQARNGITITDPNQEDNPIIYVNDFFCKTYGYSKNEVIGRNCRFLQKDDRNQEERKEIREAISNKQTIKRTIRNYKKDGTLIYNDVSITPIFNDKNELKFFLGIQKDVTSEKTLQKRLHISQNLSHIGYWDLDLVKNELYWSDEIYNIFEIEKNSITPSYELFLELIHPDDKELVNSAYLNSLKTKKKYSIVHRLLMKDKRVKYVEEKCNSFFDNNGVAYKSVGTVQDITELKKIEIELKKTISFFESYKIAIDESSMVSKSDLKGNITYANNNFCKISGYTKEEVIGKTHSIVRHPDNPKELFEDLWKTIKSKKIWKKTFKNMDKSGNTYWINSTILPILDENGSICEYIAVRHDITKMMKQQKKLDTIAQTDLLTNLGNRYKLLLDIEESRKPALAILNMDNFSQINDFYGHELGDYILKEFASKLNSNNDCNKCKIYRLQSDEFVLFYKDLAKEEFIEKVLIMKEKLLNDKIMINNDYLDLNFSIAISSEEKEKILSTADMAIKIAKNNNKDFVVYDETLSLNNIYENNIKWTKSIKNAIEKNKIVPVFQAIVNNKTLKWEKYESLVRIEEDEKLISPFFFLEISKKTRHYSSITKIMIKKSFETFKDEDVEFSINLTVEDILNEEIKEFIYETLKNYKNNEKVVFEIVESESIENFNEVIKFIKTVKTFGCSIAIDDFGTGYSNFQYLAKLEADYIKIDGSLIHDIDKNSISEIVCKNIVNFAKDLGMKTIAEYVENKSIFNKVRELGIDYSQGYYFTEPKKRV